MATIDEVKQQVGDDPELARVALEEERAGRNRVTLIDHLEGVIARAGDESEQAPEPQPEPEPQPAPEPAQEVTVSDETTGTQEHEERDEAPAINQDHEEGRVEDLSQQREEDAEATREQALESVHEQREQQEQDQQVEDEDFLSPVVRGVDPAELSQAEATNAISPALTTYKGRVHQVQQFHTS